MATHLEETHGALVCPAHRLRNIGIEQGWATLFDSRATLETNLVYAGHYKYTEDIFIDKTMFFVNLWKISTLRGIFSVYKTCLNI